MDIGSLTGELTITDSLSSVLEEGARKVEEFAESFEGMTGLVIGASLAAVAAIGAITAAIVEMGEAGTKVQDVTEGFDRLSASAGGANAVLSAMREGVAGTVDDLTLMTDANKLLAVGALSNAQDFGTLTEASRVLSREGFGSVEDVMNSLDRAMETGQTRRIALMGVTVDSKGAEEAYAASLGITAADLTKSQKLFADRQAVLEALQHTVASAGDQELSFGEKIDQVKVAISNFDDQLNKAVATSPVLAAAFDGVKNAFEVVFGNSQETMIEGIMSAINHVIIYILDLGIGSTQVATVLITAWNAIKVPILAVEQVVVGLAADFLQLVDIAVNVASKVPGVGTQFASLKGTMDGLTTATKQTAAGLEVEFNEAVQGVEGHSALQKTVDQVAGALFVARDNAVAAAGAQNDLTKANAGTAASIPPLDEGTQKLTVSQKAIQKAYEDVKAAGVAWQYTLQDINPVVVQNVEDSLRAGVSASTLATLYGLLPVQIKAIENELAFEKSVVDSTIKSHINLGIVLLSNADGGQSFRNEMEGLTADGLIPSDNAVTLYNKHLLTLKETTGAVNTTITPLKEGVVDLNKDLGQLSGALTQLATISGGTFGGMAKDAATAVSALNSALKGLADFQKASGGIQNGVQTPSSLIGQAASALTVVSAIGTGISLVGNLIKGLNIGGPSKDELASRADLSSFLSTYETKSGDQASAIQPIEDQLTQIGFNADQAQSAMAKLLDAKTPAAFAAALAPIKTAITTNTNTATAVTSLQSLVTAYTSAGHVLPASLQATLTTLSQMKGLTADEQTAIASLASSSKTDFDSLTTTATNLGLTLQQLGPKFEAGKVTQDATAFAQQITDLTSAGGDLGSILQGTASQFGDIADKAIETGAVLPSTIEPYMKNLFDTGQLVDSAGNKITDFTQIKFDNAPVTTGLDGINASVNTLQDSLANGIPTALNDLLKSIPNNPFQNWAVPNLPSAATGDGGAAAMSAGGTVYASTGFGGDVSPFVPRGTDTVPAMLTPGEKVSSVAQVGADDNHTAAILSEQRAIRSMLQTLPITIANSQRYATLVNGA